MKIVEPSARRSTIHEGIGQVEVRIPARRNWFILLFMSAWLVMWGLGEGSAISALIKGTEDDGFGGLFLVVWLCGWTLGGMFASYVLLWGLVGFEQVTLRNDLLTIKRNLAGLGFSRAYRLEAMGRLRVRPVAARAWHQRVTYPGFGDNGLLAFDYGASKVTFGEGIDEAEASWLVHFLGERGVGADEGRAAQHG